MFTFASIVAQELALAFMACSCYGLGATVRFSRSEFRYGVCHSRVLALLRE